MAFEYQLKVTDAQGRAATWWPADELPRVPVRAEGVCFRCGQCGIIFGSQVGSAIEANMLIRCQNCGAFNTL